jgi:tight adherence protein B
MSGSLVFLLCLVAALLYGVQGSVRCRAPRQRRNRVRAASRKAYADCLHELPMFVRQLAALLRSGSTPARMWTEAGRLYGTGDDGPARGAGREPGGPEALRQAGLSALLQPGIRAAGQAAGLGLSVAAALRHVKLPSGMPPEAAAMTARLWRDLGACWDAAEQTGAPLALLLENYAHHLQHQLDAAAARRTALAGPRATTTLLGWLPLLGLGLGMAMGADPLGILLGAPSGWLILAVGLALLAAGRHWSLRLVNAAARE